MKYKLITFGEGLNHKLAAKRLETEAKNSNYFSEISIYSRGVLNKKRLITKSIDYYIRNNKRGSGFWIWKPIIIAHELLNLSKDVSGLVYLDAGCSINVNKTAEKRFKDYIDLTSEASVLGFQISLLEKHWTKADLFSRLNAKKSDIESGQIESGITFWKNSKMSIDLACEWIKISQEFNMHYLDDSESIIKNNSDFVEHRHDQSIFSLLMKSGGFGIIPDETYWSPNWVTNGFDYPIWATRHTSIFDFKKSQSSRVLKYAIRLEKFLAR